MRCSCLLLAALAACSRTDEVLIAGPSSPVEAPAAAPVVETIAKGSPHGEQIEELAITEEADAAITFDALGGMRLWPTLDGTRPPVAITADAPRELSLVHAGRDFVTAILDDANGVRVLRVTRDGTIKQRVSLPGEYLQAIALDKGIVVRTTDHAIEWYSFEGELHGRVVADPSQHVHRLVNRRGHAMALVGDAKRGVADQLRFLVLGDSLVWSAPVALPTPTLRPELFALSPGHKRIAYVDQAGFLMVYDIGTRLERHEGNTLSSPEPLEIGFIDDNHVAVTSTSSTVNQLWTAAPAAPTDPWDTDVTSLPSTGVQANLGGHDIAIGDHMIVRGSAASLALITESRVRYLGYKDLTAGALTTAGSQLALSVSNSRFLWLDDKLELKNDVDLQQTAWMYGTPIDEHHVVTQSAASGTYEATLVDTRDLTSRIKLGSWSTIERIEYTPETHLLAIAHPGKVERWHLDLDKNIVAALEPLRVRGSTTSAKLLDPARSDGIVAITNGWENDSDYSVLTEYRMKGKKIERKRVGRDLGGMLAIDETGKIFIKGQDDHETSKVIVRRGTKKLATIRLPELAPILTIAPDGSRIAYVNDNHVVVTDADGKVLWRQPLFGAGQLLFTSGTAKLVVRAPGGFVVLDGATGVRVAMECGWGFGLHSTVPSAGLMHQAPVCEDPTLQ